MGYCSNVAICLKTKDAKSMYEKALQEFNDDVKDSKYVLDLLNAGYINQNMTLTQNISTNDKIEIILNDLNRKIEENTKYVVLRFEWLKWYDSYSDVGWIVRNIRQFDYYEMVEIGEDNATNEERSEEGDDVYNLDVICEIDIRV